MKFCVTIPTFNRIQKMVARVAELLPQLADDDWIVIVDNATANFSVTDYPELQDSRVRVHVNETNIGLCGNLIKCFEHAVPADWQWILSDDDVVLPDSIESIKKTLAEFPLAGYINFQSSMVLERRKENVICNGVNEFINKLDGLSNLLLISNGLFKRDVFIKYLGVGYRYCNCNAPHVAMLVSYMQDGGQMILSQREVVSWQKPDPRSHWNGLAIYNLMYILDLIDDNDCRRSLAKTVSAQIPALERLAIQSLHADKFNPNSGMGARYFYLICSQYLLARASKLRVFILMIIYLLPRFAYIYVGFAYRLRTGMDIRKELDTKRFRPYI